MRLSADWAHRLRMLTLTCSLLDCVCCRKIKTARSWNASRKNTDLNSKSLNVSSLNRRELQTKNDRRRRCVHTGWHVSCHEESSLTSKHFQCHVRSYIVRTLAVVIFGRHALLAGSVALLYFCKTVLARAIYVRSTVNTVFIDKHCCSLVLMLRLHRLEQSSLICEHRRQFH